MKKFYKTKKLSRRSLLQHSVAGTATIAGVSSLGITSQIWAAPEDVIVGNRKPFVLYIHFGSSCGISSGLVQPLKKGTWQKGFFKQGANEGSVNPLINTHTQVGSLVFNEYNKMLANVAEDLCLVNGTPISLDHNVAQILQQTGSAATGVSPEWAMAIAEQVRTDKNPNPMCITTGSPTFSTGNVAVLNSNSIGNFRALTSDVASMPKGGFQKLNEVFQNRFNQAGIGSVALSSKDMEKNSYNLGTLLNGLPALEGSQTEVSQLDAALSNAKFNENQSTNPDRERIRPNNAFKNQLILAGVLAKRGIASGMTIKGGGQDAHAGGADINTARFASQRWNYLSLFWKWIKENGLDEDVTIIVSHEFGRTPYNGNAINVDMVNASQQQRVSVPGRDHGLNMGMMFFNKNVPSSARIGNISDNLTAVFGTDTAGGFDQNKSAFTSTDIVGSMMMRLYPGLFPSERIVRKHWNGFKEIAAILG